MNHNKLTDNFEEWEASCKDGSPLPAELRANAIRIASIAEVLRAYLSQLLGRDCPLDVVSWYRTPAYNAKKKGAGKSQHMQAKAMDLSCEHFTPRQVCDAVLHLHESGAIRVGGVGLYEADGFVHIDCGAPGRRWGGA